jgi:molecular chaperone DnaK
VQSLENAITEARKAMEQGGVEGMKTATDNLQKASHKLAEIMYQQATPPGGAGAGAGSAGGGAGAGSGASADDVIEAEVVDEAK